MHKAWRNRIFDLFLLLIITVPSYWVLLNNRYFSMHDDQHIARLYLLIEGIKQGQFYPRWVDMLGFGYGYPLFNFYPPLIYYVAAGFHFIGFSLIWSIKLMIICGFIMAALGMFYLIKQLIGRGSAFLGSAVYTYFLYHSVTVYVRGALAEFFTMAILPFVFLGLVRIYKKPTPGSSLFFAFFFAALILTHPLIAFPSVIFISMISLFLLLKTKEKKKFLFFLCVGGVFALGLSSFFWIPSMVERKYTMTDEILTKELANYKDYFVYPQQLWYSPWGYGGSVKGLGDGMTFQLGKVPILLLSTSFILALISSFRKRKRNLFLLPYLFTLFLLLFSLFMTTGYSSFLWDRISYLSYMQFPWRFLTFVNVFISIICAFSIFFLSELLKDAGGILEKYKNVIIICLTILSIGSMIFRYAPYFKPQRFINTNDRERTSFNEIVWRISGTSYEFVPKGVETKKTRQGTTTLAIEENQLPLSSYQIMSGQGSVQMEKDIFNEKSFTVDAVTPLIFRLNTYNFPGWTAVVDGNQKQISDGNRLKLITISMESGKHQVEFVFKNTSVRTIASFISVFFLIAFLGGQVGSLLLQKFKKID